MSVALISHPDCLLHDMGYGHPESPARLKAIQEHLASTGLGQRLQYHESPIASRAQLERVHDPAYVEDIFQAAPKVSRMVLDPDTSMNPFTLSAALHAAGAVVQGVDLVMSGQVDSAFCAIRPPGHHAQHNRAMGFCFFNNIAVGAAHALAHHGLERLAIMDFDVHHGNGTEDIFGQDGRVLFCSTFQHPYYPFQGTAPTEPHVINSPLPAGAGSEEFRQVVTTRWLPALEEFKPQLVMFSAGFDGHRDDTLAQLMLEESDYAWVTTAIKKLAVKHARGRMVSTLEGGYQEQALARSVKAHIEGLLDDTMPTAQPTGEAASSESHDLA